MVENIYESIIKNSKIAYLKITCKKDNDDKYIGVNVIEQSKEFERIIKLVSGDDLLDKNDTEVIINDFIKKEFTQYEFTEFIEKTIEKGHSKIDNYITNDNEKILLADIYYLKEYFLIIYDLEYTLDNKLNDITMQKNEENFREITKYCDSVFIIGNRKRATYISPSFINIFEEEPDNLYKDINKIYSYFGENNKDNDFGKCNNTNMHKEGVVKVKLKNNKSKWIWYKFLPIKNNKGEVEKYVGILTDVTEKKKLEESQNKSKLDFFANVSHELRTPINLISSTIQLLKMNIDKLSQEENIDKYLSIMESNTLRLIKLVNNILDSSRVDAGYVAYNPVSGDIIYFVEEICLSTLDFAKVNNMEIVFDTNSEEEMVLFDQDIIERVMLNLLSNALKFNKENGTIYVTIDVRENEIEIRVKDEGKGIPKENLELIFKRFEQVHSINKIEKKGTGIGLYLVKSLLELHGGNISVESELDKGSEFIVTIPKKSYDLREDNTLNECNSIFDKINIEFSDI